MKQSRMGQLQLTALLACWLPAIALAQSTSEEEILERLRRLEENQARFEKLLEARDAKIRELEAELEREREIKTAPQTAESAPTALSAEQVVETAESTQPARQDQAESVVVASEEQDESNPFGEFTPGRGFTVARTKYGTLDLSLYTYLRYLNQKGLDDSYVDHFGEVQPIDIRNDFQVNKVFLYTKGWLFDPRFRYNFYVWSTNTALGTTTNNLVAGSLSYKFSDAFNLTGGVVGLPATRSMMGQFPYWQRVDARLIADEFMRGSFTQGLSADGRLAEGLNYRFALGNNLSNFGVSASKLDDGINTYSGALVWMPTTGEFGPRASIGDYEYHTELATLFGLHGTISTEDKQSQPGLNDPENTQIRLSDGITVFTADALAPGVTVTKLDYQLMALNGAMKYRGFALEGEVFYRWLDNFRTETPLYIDKLVDKGAQLKTSYMMLPKTLQLYANGSKIYGEYGDPWDAGIGFNWWPFNKRGFRINSEVIYLRHSPVGYSSLPYSVGSNGWVFVVNTELAF